MHRVYSTIYLLHTSCEQALNTPRERPMATTLTEPQLLLILR